MKLSKSYEIDATVEQVYGAWVSNDTVIPPATAMEVDPKEGGIYRLVASFDGQESTMIGRFKTVRPLEHLEYSWEWNHDGDKSWVRVDFTDLGGRTRVNLEHDAIDTEETMGNLSYGWDSYLAGLEKHLQEG